MLSNFSTIICIPIWRNEQEEIIKINNSVFHPFPQNLFNNWFQLYIEKQRQTCCLLWSLLTYIHIFALSLYTWLYCNSLSTRIFTIIYTREFLDILESCSSAWRHWHWSTWTCFINNAISGRALQKFPVKMCQQGYLMFSFWK